MLLSHDSWENNTKTQFLLKKLGYSLAEQNSMLPYEKEIVIGLLTQDLQKQNNNG